MATLSSAPRPHKKLASYNKKQAIKAFLQKYKHVFGMDDDSIDLREMSTNFNNGPIPVQEIHDAIVTVLGPTFHNTIFNHDPSHNAQIVYGTTRPKVYFDYINWEDIYLWTIFQRDVDPKHIQKIHYDFDETATLVSCMIKITLNNEKTIYCVWDGHHTIQVCRLQGYKKFPAWVIDLDQYSLSEIENAGFGDTDSDRIKFGCWVAGRNMRRINGLNKKFLHPYDDFMIGYESNDPKFVTMMNILNFHQCKPMRHPNSAGAWTQIKSGIECFNLEGPSGPSNGLYWSRALAFNRKHWTNSHLVLEIFRPMSYLYQWAANQGLSIPASFDDEFALMLINRWGDAETIQESIKQSYWNAVNQKTLNGVQPLHDKFRVLNGIINFYKQNGGKVLLPPPTCQWIV